MKVVGIFLTVWLVVVFLNQVLFYSACFKSHCLVAAVPHTILISLVVTLLLFISQIFDRKNNASNKHDNRGP